MISIKTLFQIASLRINGKLSEETFYVKSGNDRKDIYSEYPSIESIKAVYRNLRENYEYRLRYDEAGQFFIREMELKRKYHEDRDGNIMPTNIFRRNFSLTGFYRLASYGERLRMPVIFSLTTLSVSILFWLWHFQYLDELFSTGTPIQLGNVTERSLVTFLQLRNENFIWFDYIMKALGIFSLGLFAIPLRRKFERKFRH